MKQLKHITTPFFAQLLVLAIVFPSIVQFTHIFQDHEHTFCGNVETHLHEQKLDCQLDHFQVISYNFIPQIDFVSFPPEAYFTVEILTATALYNSLKQTYSLRGPPSLLVTSV
ncbi:hypothetical protein [Rasiella sp. SM2506]|uniref:hypothetical protein n=1 Tax=Rasiella sp. SM2506 TaxID=3423914 RepID=UPI003D7B42A7